MMYKKKLLLIDDDYEYIEDLKLFLSSEFNCDTASEYHSARQKFKSGSYDLIVLDIHLGKSKSGIDLLQELRKSDPVTPVIMVTRFEDVETVVTAMNAGANDYLKKPLNYKEFKIRLQKAFKSADLLKENLSLKAQLQHKQVPFFGSSPAIQKIKQTVKKIAPQDSCVLIRGETGVGKEILAREIHRNSSRRDKPFFIINCNAIPDNLIESELFGHEKGAFTGALKTYTGKLEQASNSTLLIDEIGELSPEIQTKLLNVLESQQFYRLGGDRLIQTNVRFIFATNKNLREEVRAKRFREDLFYRINVISVEIPPLRERTQDIDEIIGFYLDVFSRLSGKEKIRLSSEAIEYMKSQLWPGNVRELKNVLERACVLNECDTIGVKEIQSYLDMKESIDTDKTNFNLDYNTARQKVLNDFQKKYIDSYLKRTNGNISEAARLMGINRTSLQRMIRDLDE